MIKKYLACCIYPLLLVTASAQNIVDCRVATAGVRECDPYSTKLLIAKEVAYQKDKKKLIAAKTLPVPEKKSVKVISVIDMIEKYVKVEKPIRYEGSKKRQLETLNIESPKDTNSQSLSVELDQRREETLQKLLQMQLSSYSKMTKTDIALEDIHVPKPAVKPKGFYTVEKGDTVDSIAQKFCLSSSAILKANDLKAETALKKGTKVNIPLAQKMIDIIAKAEYVIEPGDNISTIARDFNLSSADIKKYNRLDKKAKICIGKKLILPFPHKLKVLEKAYKVRILKERMASKKASKIRRLKERMASRRSRLIRGLRKHKLRVTATAYSSHRKQTDSTPFLAAWNNRIRPGMKIIAVSRDMLTTYGLRNGSKVRIGGLRGYYTVRDKMNKRYRKRIDIYMGTNRRKALRWGRRSVIIYY